MSEDNTAASTAPDPVVRRGPRISVVWVIPIVAALLGLWLVNRYHAERGDVVVVSFENAEGLEVSKTKVKCRDVEIGEVESIALTDDLDVKVGLRIRSEHLHLIRHDSQFWVTRAQIRAGTISGLGTLLSGAFVEVEPGSSGETKRDFVGLESPPLTPASVPGLRMALRCTEPGPVDVGSGIYFKDNLVGRVESRSFDPQTEEVTFGVFVEEQFARLVTTGSRFWIGKSLELNMGPEGIDLELSSLAALVSGKVAFGVPEGADRGQPMAEGAVAELFESREEAEAGAFEVAAQVLLLLDQSVRGLSEGSPVEYRGLRVGRVSTISYDLVPDGSVEEIPVLVSLNQHLLEQHFPPSLLDEGGEGLAQALDDGLRASLKSSNLLTGQVYVDLDFYPDLPSGPLVMAGEYPVLPTVESGLGRLEDRLAMVLDKLNSLPIETLLAEVEATAVGAQDTLSEMRATLASVESLLNDDATRAIPDDIRETLASVRDSLRPLSNEGQVYGDLRRTMDEMRSAIRSLERMTDTIGEKPNSLLFGRDKASKAIPRAKP